MIGFAARLLQPLFHAMDPEKAHQSFADRSKFYAQRGSEFYWPQGEAVP